MQPPALSRTRALPASCAGKSVSRIQHVGGVDFSYQPPPRNIVPYAASLKGQSSAR